MKNTNSKQSLKAKAAFAFILYILHIPVNCLWFDQRESDLISVRLKALDADFHDER